MTDLEVIRSYVFSMLNVPYLWGGDSPLNGLDCSGFALQILDAMGITKPKEDTTAKGIHDLLYDGNNQFKIPKEGCFIFYGRSKSKITHVMYALNSQLCIGATGGGSGCYTKEIAAKADARVKILPYKYRSDIVAIIDPSF